MYQFESRIRYSEVDAWGRLKLLSLLDYFQDASVFHSEDLGVGVDYLASKKEAWVLSSWQICINELPSLASTVKVQTWAYDMKAFWGSRNFALRDSSNKLLAYANSLWVYMDMENERPKKIDPALTARYGLEEPLSMPDCKRKLKLPAEMEEREPIPVLKHYIDTNMHMNNGRYVLLAYDFLPENFKLNQLVVEYKKAAKLGDTLYPRIAASNDHILVSLEDDARHPYAIIDFS